VQPIYYLYFSVYKLALDRIGPGYRMDHNRGSAEEAVRQAVQQLQFNANTDTLGMNAQLSRAGDQAQVTLTPSMTMVDRNKDSLEASASDCTVAAQSNTGHNGQNLGAAESPRECNTCICIFRVN